MGRIVSVSMSLAIHSNLLAQTKGKFNVNEYPDNEGKLSSLI